MSSEHDQSPDQMPEIDLAQFPQKAGCNIFPSVDESMAEVEVLDAEQRATHAQVPADAVTSFGVHNLYHGLPEDKRDVLKDQLGAGMVACKIIEEFEGQSLVRIELPSYGEPVSVLVPKARLARRV